MEPKITRLPSQATHGNGQGRRPRPEAFASRQERERRDEAYLIDGRQPYRY